MVPAAVNAKKSDVNILSANDKNAEANADKHRDDYPSKQRGHGYGAV
jgi:hypothetical protein